jgi:hypothetical protein
VKIGDLIYFNYGVDERIPAIVEKVRKEPDTIELSYLYKGQWSFAIAKRGTKVYEWQARNSFGAL